MWNIFRKYIWNIYIYIYMEYIKNIHKYLWYKIIRNTDTMGRPPKAAAPVGHRRRRRLCFWLFHIINICGFSLYIPHIFHISFLNMFHIFSLVCFLSFSVNSSSGHDRSQSFGPISHVSGRKLSCWGNFIMVLHGFAWRSSKNTVFHKRKSK